MVFVKKIASFFFLNLVIFFTKRIALIATFALLFVFALIYISYPYITIKAREGSTSKYLRAVEVLYQNKNKTRADLINEVKKQTNTNALSLLIKFLPEINISKEEKIKIFKKFAKLTSASPIVYDFFVIKFSDLLIEKNDPSCVRYLDKISKDHPSFDVAQKKIITFFLINKNFKSANKRIADLERQKIDVTELKELSVFLNKQKSVS